MSPTQVAVGPKGEVYVLYSHHDAEFKPAGWEWGRSVLRLVRSEDGGKRFSAPVEIGTEPVEGLQTSVGMLHLFAAPNGDLYASFLDYREDLAYRIATGKEPPKDQEPPTQLRVARSTDSGRSFGRSSLVSKPTCGCCGTKVAQGVSGPLYATTRGQSQELKGSVDAVRDHFVAVSRDGGTNWSEPVKFHDDRFKISGCPDISPGLAVDSKGRLHAAWYTGSERHPGVFYARSDDEGKGFSKPIALLSDDWIPYGDVKLALDTRDNAWVAFEDRRGDEDLIQVAMIAPDGTRTLSQAWPGTAPDVATEGDTAIVAWGTKGQGDEEAGGGIRTGVISLPESP
ncbi:MAG: sialidase family protein [Gammaproteobacteria bacterium]